MRVTVKKLDTKPYQRHEELTEKIYAAQGQMLPSRYVFVLTTKCNLSCDFCFQDHGAKGNLMQPDDWINVAKQLPDYARVTLTGGEPFLYKGFKKVYEFIVTRFQCVVITNGMYLNEELIDFLLSFPKLSVLSVSIDNIGNTIRNVKPKQWDKIEQMMRYFARKRDAVNSSCLLDVKTTILDINAHELLAVHRYCFDRLHCDTHVFQFLKGSELQHSDRSFTLDDCTAPSKAFVYERFDIIKEQLEKVQCDSKKLGRTTFLHPKVNDLMGDTPLSNLDILNNALHDTSLFELCKFPWSSVHINPDGVVIPCLATPMGNIQETSLKEILADEPMKRFLTLIQKEGTVQTCNRCGWLRPTHRTCETP